MRNRSRKRYIKVSEFKRHLETIYPNFSGRPSEFFQEKLEKK